MVLPDNRQSLNEIILPNLINYKEKTGREKYVADVSYLVLEEIFV